MYTAQLLIAVLLALTAPTSATPIDSRDRPWSVYICEVANWGGGCSYITGTQGECMNINPGSVSNIRSFGPDRNQLCRLYDQPDCAAQATSFDHLDLTYPGIGDLRVSGWAGRVLSYRCVEPGTTPVP